jgi:hypothetical protein
VGIKKNKSSKKWTPQGRKDVMKKERKDERST